MISTNIICPIELIQLHKFSYIVVVFEITINTLKCRDIDLELALSHDILSICKALIAPSMKRLLQGLKIYLQDTRKPMKI